MKRGDGSTALHSAAVALGSNLPGSLGSTGENLHEAIRRLGTVGRVTGVSTFHRTEAVGYLEQPDFLNAAALLQTDLAPLALLRGLLRIEAEMGRDRGAAPPKGPRIIDLDLLLYDDLVLATPELILPHPAMQERGFVLAPLAEIAPEWPHPVLRATVGALLAQLRR